MTSKAIICDTENVIAIEQDLGGDSVVVTFNDLTCVRNGLRFWGDAFLLQEGISAIGIVTPKPNWYPPRAMDEVIAAVLEKIKGRKVVTFGYSQGGYGALKFSARLGASAALSICPQWSIDPADVASFDSRFTGYFDPALEGGRRIEPGDLCSGAFIVFDKQQKADRAQVAKLTALTAARSVVASFVIQDLLRLTKEGASLAAQLLRLCLTDALPSETDLRQIIRASRRKSKSYYNSMLRQLFLRMGKSRRRSSVFVSALLAATGSDNPFYSSLVNYGKGDATMAVAELAKATAKDFDGIDLVSLWRVANGLRFLPAELAVATRIFAKYPSNTYACLLAVGTLIRTGDLEGAQRELMRVAKHADAMSQIGQFIDLSLKLHNADAMEALVSDDLPQTARLSLLFRLVDFYRRLGDRPSAFHRALDIAAACADSPEDLRKLAAIFVELGEFTYALETRERLLRSAPEDCFLALDIFDVKVRITLNKYKVKDRAQVALKKIQAELTQYMLLRDLPAAAWERASQIYAELGDLDAALQAIRKAVDGPEPVYSAQLGLVVLLMRKDNTRAAILELTALLAQYHGDPNRLRSLGNVARRLPARELARKFAEAQFQLEPRNPEAILYLAQQLRMDGDRTRALELLSSLFHNERRAPFISDQQWVRLAQELYEVGEIALTKEAIAEVVAREPNNPLVRTVTATTALLEKFGEGASTGPSQEAVHEPVRQGLASRLARMLRR